MHPVYSMGPMIAMDSLINATKLWRMATSFVTRKTRDKESSRAGRTRMLAAVDTEPALRRVALLAIAGTEPRHRAAWGRRQWRPAGDAPGARPRMGIVGDAREPASQLDHGRQLAVLIESGADRGGIFLGDDEHLGDMGRPLRCQQALHGSRLHNEELWILASEAVPARDPPGPGAGGQAP